MSSPYGDVAFTEQVRAAQSRYGRRSALARLGMGEEFSSTSEEPHEALTPFERDFIATLDGFYLATVSSTDWPYAQFRGGPPGFVRVPDEHTLRWADFRGNCQYISTGNLASSRKVSLFFMDYTRRARLKVFGHADVVDVRHDREAAQEVAVKGYRAILERIVTVDVVAYDWNCPQHIPQRFTIEELRDIFARHGIQPGSAGGELMRLMGITSPEGDGKDDPSDVSEHDGADSQRDHARQGCSVTGDRALK